jgi:hypothetical protein
MEFTEEIKKYIDGEKFSNGLEIQIANKESTIYNRLRFLENLVAKKRVIHLGCCDHLPLIEEKIKQNIWLHKRIDDVTNHCLGIDINNEGINYLKQKLKYENVICANILSQDIPEIKENKWDYLIMGEILEHVDDPVSFLREIKIRYSSNIKKIVITVPNAFAHYNFKAAAKNIEVINTDHRFWFTPFTLAKVLVRAGYKLSSYYFAQDISNKIGNKAKILILPYIVRKKHYKLLLNTPTFRDTLIMIAFFNEE